MKVLSVKNIQAYKNGFFYIGSNFKSYKKVKLQYLNFGIRTTLIDYVYRFLRRGVHNILIHDNYIVVVKKGKILIYVDNKLRNLIKIDRGSRPLKQGVLIFDNKLYYGDYFSNPDRKDVYIYEVDLKSFNKRRLVTIQNVRHIHFIQQNNQNKDELFIGTGDEDNESNFYSYSIKKDELNYINGGSQTWRSVSLLQKKNLIIWGSDCPYKENYIYSYDLIEKKLIKLFKIDGPAYYSTYDKSGNLFIATTIENKSHKAKVYKSSDGKVWSELIEFKKDNLPPKLFGYGTIEFIQGQSALEDLYINIRGLKWKKK